MYKKELNKIKKAIRSMKNENHTFYIEGKDFSCRWNGKSFEWKAPSGTVYDCNAKEIISYIGNGEYIKTYCCDYVAE